MKKYRSYLEIIQYDPKLSLGILAKYLTNIRVVLLVVSALLIFGGMSVQNLPRRLNPEVQIPIVSVTTLLSGAAPDEVERLVTKPLESELQNARKLDSLTSSSLESASSIVLQFSSDVDPDEAQDEVQRLISNVSDLPEDATTPMVKALDFEDVPVWQFVLRSKSGDVASLDRISLQLQDVIESTSGIDRVVLTGREEQEVRVTINQERASELGLDPFLLSTAIKNATKSWPAGSVSSGATSFSVSMDAQVQTLQELTQLPVKINEQVVLLGDVADISRKSAPQQKRTYFGTFEGKNIESAIGISVYKVRGVDITTAQSNAEQAVVAFMKPYEQTIEVVTLTNVATDITDQFTDLVANFSTTILLVFITLLLFLGLRQAILTSFAVPLSFLSAFIVMNVTGQSLNFLSLFALLIALGLLVDNAIVIVTSMTEYYKSRKFSPAETGLLVFRDFNIPIWTTTLTTVWAFLPLLLATGIIGEFIKPIPIIVSSTLLASALIALFITLPLMIVLLKFKLPKRVVVLSKMVVGLIVLGFVFQLTQENPAQLVIMALTVCVLIVLLRWRVQLVHAFQGLFHPDRHRTISSTVREVFDSGLISMDPVTRYYQERMDKILQKSKYKWLVIGMVSITAVFSYILLPLGYIESEFFPASDADVIYLTVELPVGTVLAETERVARNVFVESLATTGIEFGVLEIGEAPSSGVGISSSARDNIAGISLRLMPADEREVSSLKLVPQLRDTFDSYNQAKVTVSAPSGGPPAGSDITVKVLGEDLDELNRLADAVVQRLEETEGVVNIDKSAKAGASKIVFEPILNQVVTSDISLQTIGFWLRIALSGFELATFTPEGQSREEAIQLYLTDGLASVEELSGIGVQTKSGTQQIGNLGTLKLQANPTVISREDGKRSITVTAGVETGVSANEVNNQLFAWLDEQNVPPGYSFATGGANEENQSSVQSILQAMVLSIVLILATMIIQLGSFRKALIIVMVIPLAVTGVFLLFALTGTPLSFPALIGVLALFGIVVNNSIVMVDKINENSRVGMNSHDAIIDAAGSRLQPIFFSSLTTIIGLIPITLSDPIWTGLGGALIAGLSFSGLTMLIFIPTVYSLFFSGESTPASVGKRAER